MEIVLATSPHLNHSALLTSVALCGEAPVRSIAQTFVPMGLLSLAGAAPAKSSIQIRDINKAIDRAIWQIPG